MDCFVSSSTWFSYSICKLSDYSTKPSVVKFEKVLRYIRDYHREQAGYAP